MNERWTRVAIVAIAAGILARVLWVLIIHPPYNFVFSDMGGYVDRAIRVATAAEPARYDAFYPPGPHLLLALPMILVGTGKTGLWLDAFLWTVLSSVIPFALWRFCALLLSARAAALAAVFAALYPLFIVYSGYFLSETPALAFLLLSLWAGYKAAGETDPRRALRLALVAGVCGGLAFMCRPQSILNLLILVVPLVRVATLRRRVVLPLAAGFAILFMAQAAYDSVAAGRLTLSSENGGMTFFLGHCDVATMAANDGATLAWTFAAPVAVQRGGGRNYVFNGVPVWEQSFYYQRGFDCIREDGLGHVRLLLRSLVDMGASTVPWPPSQEAGVRDFAGATNTFYTITLIAIVFFALTLVRRRRPYTAGVRILLLNLAMVVPVALLFFGDPRFRISYDAFGLALFAAVLSDPFEAVELDEGEQANGSETHAEGEESVDEAEAYAARSDRVEENDEQRNAETNVTNT